MTGKCDSEGYGRSKTGAVRIIGFRFGEVEVSL